MTPRSALSARLLALSLAASLSLACSSGDDEASPQGSGGAGGSGGQAGASASTGSLTYYRDAKPIIDARCVTCHHDGAIGPFPLTTYDEVVAHKNELLGAVKKRTMPPWPPAADCQPLRNVRALSDAEIASLSGWVEAGALAGEPGAVGGGGASGAGGSSGSDGTGLSRADRDVPMPMPYTPQLAPDEYRCFMMDWPEQEARYVTGFRGNPGDGRTVHHMIAYVIPPEEIPTYQALDDADPGFGYPCFGGPGGPRPRWLGSWTPGSMGADYPEGTGIRVDPGSRIVLQVHYHLETTPVAPDQSSFSVKLDPQVAHESRILPFADPNWIKGAMPIPMGKSDVVHTFSAPAGLFAQVSSGGQFKSDKPVKIHGANLHMHTRGTRGRLWVERASGGAEQCMLRIDEWDFHWQGLYLFEQPIEAAADDKVHVECHFDNEKGDHDINWGEGTADEMCLSGIYLTQ